MEYYKPVISYHKKSEEVSRSQYWIEEEAKYKCFWYEHSKLECKGAKDCTFDKKVDELTINSFEVVARKF